MSNYTQIVSYGPKDSLSHGDPNKALKGVQIDAELSAISTAIATKIDTPLQNIMVTGTANNNALSVSGAATSGQSFGILALAGTTSADYNLSCVDKSSNQLFKVRGDGHLFAGSFDFTPSTGSFSATYSGTISGAVTLAYIKIGNLVTLYSASSQAVSTASAGTFTVSSLPAAIRPTQTIVGGATVSIGGGAVAGTVGITAAGVMNFASTTGGALGSGNVGFVVQTIATYVIQ